jgi:DNA invertase Pin-like site-specific DNA recombinase
MPSIKIPFAAANSSSVAQQEVENISANVKKGLKMKMKRGELVGFQG